MTKINKFLLFALLVYSSIVSAEENQEPTAPRKVEYKLTLSDYESGNTRGDDINIRGKLADETAWLGYYYERSSNFRQLRAGYEHTSEFELANVVTSLQAANHGFLGFAVTAEIGKPFYGILGYGRTNLKPYANLNFDPNDAVTYGVGWESENNLTLTLFAVRDNRVIPDQQIAHLVMRKQLPDNRRVTLDIFHKNGPADAQGQPITGTGCAFTYDFPRYFARLTYDPKVNFTQENMTRIAIGARF